MLLLDPTKLKLLFLPLDALLFLFAFFFELGLAELNDRIVNLDEKGDSDVWLEGSLISTFSGGDV